MNDREFWIEYNRMVRVARRAFLEEIDFWRAYQNAVVKCRTDYHRNSAYEHAGYPIERILGEKFYDSSRIKYR